MVDVLKDLELALEAHLDAVLAGAAAGSMLTDLDGDQRLALRQALG